MWHHFSWRQDEKQATVSKLTFDTSTISAPPVAGDVAWEMFRLAPYDSRMGGRTSAVRFLCHVYEPLKKIQKHLFATRRSSNGLLTAHVRSGDPTICRRFSSCVAVYCIEMEADAFIIVDHDCIVAPVGNVLVAIATLERISC